MNPLKKRGKRISREVKKKNNNNLLSLKRLGKKEVGAKIREKKEADKGETFFSFFLFFCSFFQCKLLLLFFFLSNNFVCFY